MAVSPTAQAPTLTEAGCRLDDLRAITAERLGPAAHPHAVAVEQVLVLAAADLPPAVEFVRAFSAAGCPFPTGPDLDPPVTGLAPPSQADVVRRAVAEGREPAAFTAALDEHARRRA